VAYTQQQVLDWLNSIVMGTLELQEDNVGFAQAAIDMINMPVSILPPGNISPHFTIEELTYSGTADEYNIDNTPDAVALEQLSLLANETLEGIRTICDTKPMIISSGYRCRQINAMIGGAADSAHLYGCAVDFTIPNFGSVRDVCHAIEPYLQELGIDQLIHENDSWVHVGRAIPPSVAPRCQCLTISKGITMTGIA
jgi:zinc D-Ala-D-Ala carboxypeptidase